MAAALTTNSAAPIARLAGGSPAVSGRVLVALPPRVVCRVARSGAARRGVQAMAAAKPTNNEVVQMAASFGLDASEGLFGFRPFSELWVGRLAMMGFLTSIVEEFLTGRGTLQQIGLATPDSTLLVVLATLATAATLAGTVATLDSARKGKLSPNDLRRYSQFFGLRGEALNIAETQRAMRLGGDFTSPDNPAAIDAAKRAGTPADAFLAPTDAGAAAAAASAMKEAGDAFALDDAAAASRAAAALKEREAAAEPGSSLPLAAREEVSEALAFLSEDSDMAYAKNVELENGRWAMLGFLAAILVEASTGQGIIGQIITYLKLSGMLGDMSGF